MQRVLRVLASTGCVVVLTVATAITAGASETLQNPATGQPGATAGHTCQIFTVTPGNSAGAGGSVFNNAGQAGNVYAGNPGTASATNSNSLAAVSQYDIACR